MAKRVVVKNKVTAQIDIFSKMLHNNHTNIFGKPITKETFDSAGNAINNSGIPHYNNVGSLLKNINSGDARSSVIDSLKTLHGLSSIIGKNLPGGNALAGASLANNFSKMHAELRTGKIKDSTLLSAASDFATLASAAAVALNPLAGLGLYVLGTALSTASLLTDDSTVANDAIGKIGNGLYNMSKNIADASNDSRERFEKEKQLRKSLFGDSGDSSGGGLLNNKFDGKSLMDLINNLDKNNIFNNGFSFADFLKGNFNFGDYLDRYSNPFFNPTVYDPLVLDLDGDGIETLSLDDGVHFDHNGDKIAHKSSWVGKDDGLLVYDKNNNGQIDDGSELFGNFTNIKGDKTAVNGYHALKDLNSNKDGVIDANDEEFKNLKIWQDKNSNGVVDSGELTSLSDHNIKSLNLGFKNSDKDLGGGNELVFEGSYTKNDDTIHQMGDLNFSVDSISSKFVEDIKLSKEQNHKINIKGSGSLRDLNQAATLSASLNNLIDSYTKASTKEEQLQILESLMKEWSKTSVDYSPYEHSLKTANFIDESTPEGRLAKLKEEYADPRNESRRSQLHVVIINLEAEIATKNYNEAIEGGNDRFFEIIEESGSMPRMYRPKVREGRLTPSELKRLKEGLKDKTLLNEFEKIKYKISIIDSFTGSKTAQLFYIDDADVKDIINRINTTYDKILKYAYNALLIQTRLKEYASLIDVGIEETVGANENSKYIFSLDYSRVIAKFEEVFKVDPKKAFMDLGEFINIVGLNNKDTIMLAPLFGKYMDYAAKNSLLNEWKDIFSIHQDISFITGGDTNDSLKGSKNNDIIYGGEGNDTLHGQDGNDTLYGNQGNDNLYGGAGNDILYGNEGSDTLQGEAGDDILEGGAGNDNLYGGEGNDIYLFGRGDGQDTINNNDNSKDRMDVIRFKEGIGKDDLVFSRDNSWGTDLFIKIKDTTDLIRIQKMFMDYSNSTKSFNDHGFINRIEFADGSFLSAEEIKKLTLLTPDSNKYINGFNTDDTLVGNSDNNYLYGRYGNDTLYGNQGNDNLYGGAGNDILYGNEGSDTLQGEAGDDILEGGAGNDNLYGGEGNDIYLFGRGDGQDTINNNDNSKDRMDVIRFKEGIGKRDISFMLNGSNLSIKYGNEDAITLSSYNSSPSYQIDKIELNNGNFITNTQINKIIQDINAFAKDNGISSINHDTIRNNNDMMNIVMNGWNG